MKIWQKFSSEMTILTKSNGLNKMKANYPEAYSKSHL